MTKADLEQIYYLDREIRIWERELGALKSRSLVRSPVANAVHGSGISDKVAAQAEKTIELENRIREKKKELEQQRSLALNFIIDIPDSFTRQIVHCRCVKLMSWQKVACAVGGSNTADSVRMAYNRFMDSL